MSILQNIRDKVRQLTGRKSAAQLSNTQIDFEINNYYDNEFPLQFRSFELRQEYSFVTTPNVDVYNVAPNTFQSVEPIGYVGGYPTLFVEDRSLFHQLFPDVRQDIFLLLGTGIAGPYAGTITGNPILKGSVLVYSNIGFQTQTSALDNSDGLLYPVVNGVPSFTATPIGTVDYNTGAILITFQAVVPSGTEIRAQSKQYNPNRPTTIFYWDNQLTLRPVPDRAYNVRIITYNYPIAIDTSSGLNVAPPIFEWWEALAYGASMKIFENNKDLASAAQMSDLLERKLVLLGRRQWFVLRSQSTKTIYNSPGLGAQPGTWYGYFGGVW